jgi:hypothetical protein
MEYVNSILANDVVGNLDQIAFDIKTEQQVSVVVAGGSGPS